MSNPILKRGAVGPAVAALQTGIAAFPADGLFGAGTEGKLRAFQAANGLQPDGVAGPATWDLIEKRTAAPRPDPASRPAEASRSNGAGAAFVSVTYEMLRAVAPRTPQTLLVALTGPMTESCRRFQIDSPVRLAAFLSQCAHECAGFTAREESLVYSTAERIRSTWPTRFPTVESARPYVRAAEKLANFVYANRMDNGASASGDGWRFRGRGFKQVTGRSNYTALAKVLGRPLDEMPAYMMGDDGACASAGWFWSRNRLNQYADVRDIRTLTFKINGGYTGLAERTSLFKDACVACGVS